MLRQKEQTEDCLTGMCSSGILSPSHLHHAEMFLYSGGRNYPAAALLLLHTFVFSKGCLVGCRGARLPIALGNGKDLRRARIWSRKECCPESSKYLAPCHCLAFLHCIFQEDSTPGLWFPCQELPVGAEIAPRLGTRRGALLCSAPGRERNTTWHSLQHSCSAQRRDRVHLSESFLLDLIIVLSSLSLYDTRAASCMKFGVEGVALIAFVSPGSSGGLLLGVSP